MDRCLHCVQDREKGGREGVEKEECERGREGEKCAKCKVHIYGLHKITCKMHSRVRTHIRYEWTRVVHK